MSIKQINARAKSIRRSHPNMAWNAAQKKAAAELRGGAKRKPAHHKAVAVTHHRTKRRVSGVGSTAVGSTKKRTKKKANWFGATGAMQSRSMQIAEIGVGMVGGMIGTHMILRPLEHKVMNMITDPKIKGYAAKAMPWGEMAVGIGMFLMSKHKIVRNIGLGVASSGVGTAIKQLPIHMHSPAESINGVGDYITTRVPINGTTRDMIAGLIQQDNGYTHTPVVGNTVGDSVLRNNGNGPVKTPTVGNNYNTLTRTSIVGSAETDDEDENLFRRNHFSR